MDETKRQEIANFRYGLIAPLVNRKLEPGQQAELLREAASHTYDIPYSSETKVSIRTLERYLQAYRKGGWEALKPSPRADKLQSREIAEDVLQKAMDLKREQPGRSVRQIIAILELAQFVEPGTIKESTLSKQLRRRGLTRKALLQSEANTFRRFEAEYRNACWQGDVQHTLYLPHPDQPGKKKMAYLVVFIDDYSRYVVHGQFYFEERVPRLEDCLKKAILKHGIPEMIYVDNGAIYSSRHFERICGRLGTQLKHTKPGRPQGRGKQEKFFRFVDQSFVPEAYDLIEQGKIQTLTDLNRFFSAWLEVAYHQKVHNSFKQRPADRYKKDEHPIRTIPPHELADVFLLEETRKVDKTGCISLLGQIYEVDAAYAGQTVQVRFDPYDLTEIQVWKDGKRQENARPLRVRSLSSDKRQEEPASPQSPPKTGLNYVELAYEEYQRQTRQEQSGTLQELMQQLEVKQG
ncbi:DDE-type integrase/transposase/recombinase [Effusibacillus lacus]|uniref:Integrase n=1 Tax=Effusibacillus lacus TaxID=1348429 RepID=A0A292YMT9_9BACL|nr:DDE-type integrase/transposase/recombinase [Effusibacillus lacus]TCS66817.1 Mu transposase-like protein [Effusibacillus lacus]GAX89815.1 integrase [Effusibacillus lacus]